MHCNALILENEYGLSERGDSYNCKLPESWRICLKSGLESEISWNMIKGSIYLLSKLTIYVYWSELQLQLVGHVVDFDTNHFGSVQSLSRVQLFVTPWTAACQASLSITNSWSLHKLLSIESVMPSKHLILCHPLLLLPSIFSSISVFSNESVLHIRWPKYWSFSFTISPSSEYSGLISFSMDWWISLLFKGLSRVFSNTTVQKHQFFGAQLSLQSNSHIHTWLPEKPQLWLDRPLLAK